MSVRRSLLRRLTIVFLSAVAAGCSSSAGYPADDVSAGEAAQTEARPPQLVLMGFDGSSSLPFWEESLAFARANPVKWTYWISGVYFIPDAAKSGYIAPHGLGAGKSAIGWGGNAATIATRYGWVKRAHSEGNEIASHANGHFDGSTWTEADWQSEFEQFDKIIFEGVGVTAPDLGFGPRDSVGFRAPQLGHSLGLYKAMPNRNYTYDVSKSDRANYWPQKLNGIWNIPLAQLRIVGSGKATLSMDYNFYVADSRAEANPAGKEIYKKQMIDTYMQYFESNYFGNRAPVQIGHHFSKWNGGAYWEAMQVVAKRICGLPEVKCVTFKEAVKFLEENATRLPTLQRGEFPKMPRPPGAGQAQAIAPLTPAEIAGLAEDGDAAHDETE
jgi:hypothetical protein